MRAYGSALSVALYHKIDVSIILKAEIVTKIIFVIYRRMLLNQVPQRTNMFTTSFWMAPCNRNFVTDV